MRLSYMQEKGSIFIFFYDLLCRIVVVLRMQTLAFAPSSTAFTPFVFFFCKSVANWNLSPLLFLVQVLVPDKILLQFDSQVANGLNKNPTNKKQQLKHNLLAQISIQFTKKCTEIRNWRNSTSALQSRASPKKAAETGCLPTDSDTLIWDSQ